jgi:hypothetical protein
MARLLTIALWITLCVTFVHFLHEPISLRDVVVEFLSSFPIAVVLATVMEWRRMTKEEAAKRKS